MEVFVASEKLLAALLRPATVKKGPDRPGSVATEVVDRVTITSRTSSNPAESW